MKLHNSNKKTDVLIFICLTFILIGMVSIGSAQNIHVLARGQYWFQDHVSGFSPTSGALFGVGPQSYPGIAPGGNRLQEENRFFAFGVRDGQTVLGGINVQELGSEFQVITPQQVNINWNLANATNQPEEQSTGTVTFASGKTTPEGLPFLNVAIEHKTNAWSIPGYDRFIIQEFTVTNQEPVTIHNFHLIFFSRMAMGNSRYDTEYIWDDQRKVFIFYDDTNIDAVSGVADEYEYGPGPVTGDVGNPQDIGVAEAPTKFLARSEAFTFGFVDMPANKYGEQEPFYMLFNWAAPAGAPERENPQGQTFSLSWEGYNNPDPNDPTAAFRLLRYPQARMSYRAAQADPNVEDGNLYERRPSLLTGIGPYDLDPQQSISYKVIWCVGDIDRTDRMTGGLDVTRTISMTQILESGQTEDDHPSIKNLRENWDRARYLIDNDYTPAYAPPPTVGAPQEIELTDQELEALQTVVEEDGSFDSGIELRFLPVPSNYTDPLTGADDFVGYKIYRSLVHPFGPYSEIMDIPKAEAVLDGDRISAKVVATSGVPYYYGVTSYDSDGNESGMTASTRYNIAAPFGFSNNPDDVRVVPNPFVQNSGLDAADLKRLVFVNIPSVCTIRIYTLAGDHIVTIDHDDGWGLEPWGSSGTESSYMLTKHRNNVKPGLYIFHIESHVPGYEGQTSIGKFVIVK